MRKLLTAVVLWGSAGALVAQSPTPAASPNDLETLRQQVQALTETVKSLQQQVKDQQSTLAKMNAGGTAVLPTNASSAVSPAPGASAPPLFPTTDESVVA
ncbi:MAG: hypothetical protein ACRD5Z_14815, partial [Bryobacteraceae bacterium]